MALELIFLGTGTSAGIPMIGCDCSVCHSTDPHDQRTRASVLLRYADRQILIDTSPDMRTQMLRHAIKTLDAVIYTHAHADHIFGLDDLRRFNAVMNRAIDIYADAATLDTLRTMFRYIFDSQANINQSFVATLQAHELTALQGFDLFDARWLPLPLMHGRQPVLGFRVDHQQRSLAYCTDVSHFPQATLDQLHHLDVLVIDALRPKPHPTHLSIRQALDIVDHLKPKQTYFTHIAHEVAHATIQPTLPPNVFLSHDGLTLRL